MRHASAKEDYGGRSLASECEKRPEIGVRREDYPSFLLREGQHEVVLRAMEVAIAQMEGIMTQCGKLTGQRRGERIIDEKPHVVTSGTSFSRTASAAK